MNKVALLIPAHCAPEILMLTVGTLLDAHDGSYEPHLFVSLHSNYSHYNKRLSEIRSMRNVNFVAVDEIEWAKYGLLRYSHMHAKCLMALLKQAAAGDFSHVAVLDHDLIFMGDFVSWALERMDGADWLCGLLDDAAETRQVKMEQPGSKLKLTSWAPKPTVWHMLLTQKAVNSLITDFGSIEPACRDHVYYDTFASAYARADNLGLAVRVLPCAEFKYVVSHIWSMSFNYGLCRHGKTRAEKEKIFAAQYRDRFPDGIGHLLEKLSP